MNRINLVRPALCAVALLLASHAARAQVGIGTTSPNSTLDVRGSQALAYATTGGSTSYNLTEADHTLRRYGNCTTIYVPDPSTCPGRQYTIMNSAGTGTSVALTVQSGTAIIYDDANNAGVNSLDASGVNSRVTIQSDGSNWLVTAR